MKAANIILFKNYFIIIEKREGTDYLKKMSGILAKCKICSGKVKGSIRVTSNFIRHLRIQHPKEYEEYEKNKKFEKN